MPLAQDFGAAPILLLDEVPAHLDGRHREALYEDLAALGAQAWMTGTDPALFSPLADVASFFRVADGSVAPGVPGAAPPVQLQSLKARS